MGRSFQSDHSLSNATVRSSPQGLLGVLFFPSYCELLSGGDLLEWTRFSNPKGFFQRVLDMRMLPRAKLSVNNDTTNLHWYTTLQF